MPTFDEIKKKLARGLIQPDEIQGVKQPIACICPNCDHKFMVIIVIQAAKICLLAPRYDRKGETQLS